MASAVLLLLAPVVLASAPVERRLTAPEADQGVAVDDRSIYAIDNNVIGRYDKRTGTLVARWTGDRAFYPHINSCSVHGRELVCAASNYPQIPMASSVEVFDKLTLKPLRTRALPPTFDSLTVLDYNRGSWWAVYANYEGRGGEPGRGSRYGRLIRLDDNFMPQESWLFPDTVVERFIPHHASGAVWGRDGLLYASGHDRPEIYVLKLPPAGSVLVHLATIPVETNGQAIDWDDFDNRLLWTIDRKSKSVAASRLPKIPVTGD